MCVYLKSISTSTILTYFSSLFFLSFFFSCFSVDLLEKGKLKTLLQYDESFGPAGADMRQAVSGGTELSILGTYILRHGERERERMHAPIDMSMYIYIHRERERDIVFLWNVHALPIFDVCS